MAVEPAGAAAAFLRELGVAELPPLTSPFDPGYDALTVEAHLAQSARLMAALKLSMATWIVADPASTQRKLAAAKAHAVPTTTGGGPFEVAASEGVLDAYLDLCASTGFDRIECGSGFTATAHDPQAIVASARDRGLAVQFELGEKHSGSFTRADVRALVDEGARWLDAGAVLLVVEARESATNVGLFDAAGRLDLALADEFAAAFGLERVQFEAPTKASQFALLDHFGPQVRLGNVRLEELLRVEIYRRGLHSDAYRRQNLRPTRERP